MDIGSKVAKAAAKKILDGCRAGHRDDDSKGPPGISKSAGCDDDLLKTIHGSLERPLNALALESEGFCQCVRDMRRGVPRQMLMELGGVSRRRWEAAREYCERVGIPVQVQRGRVSAPEPALVDLVAQHTRGRRVTIDTLVNIAEDQCIEVVDVWIAFKRSEADATSPI